MCTGNIAADDKQIPLEILFGNPYKSAPQISPDGKFLSYLAPDSHDVTNVWIHDLNGSSEDRCVTCSLKRGISTYLWDYHSRSIVYLQDTEGDENWHLYQTDLGDGSTRDLTPFPGACAGILAYEPQFPDQLLAGINCRNPIFFDVYRIDLRSGQIALEWENDKEVVGFVADHHLQVRVGESIDSEGNTHLLVRDTRDTPWRELLQWPADAFIAFLGFAEDNEHIYLSGHIDSDKAKLYRIELATGASQIIAENAYYDLLGDIYAPHFIYHPLTHRLSAVEILGKYPEWIFLDPELQQEFAHLQKPQMHMNLLSRDLEDKLWIISYTSDKEPGRYYLYDRENGKKRFLFQAIPALADYTLSEMRPVSYEARDGMLLHGYLTLPTGRPAKQLPSVIYVHGGPRARDTWSYTPTVQWLANRGYAVLQINYRGSLGYGKDYLEAGNKEWGRKMHTDLLDGKNWLIDQGYADPNKVAIYGGSYGGYATLAALAFTPEEFCCGVDIVGPSNLITLLQTIPPYWVPLQVCLERQVGSLETDQEFLKERSPLFKAHQIIRPLLIAQGANDPRVKQAESDQIVSAMRQHGKEVEYFLFPDEGHGFKRPENKLKFIRAAEAFLQKHASLQQPDESTPASR
jgi:dipeptidyl aminopeptidase/acylaminoacyl peptidase